MIERRTLCVLETTRLACPDSQRADRDPALHEERISAFH
jgi:hypothetical protein